MNEIQTPSANKAEKTGTRVAFALALLFAASLALTACAGDPSSAVLPTQGPPPIIQPLNTPIPSMEGSIDDAPINIFESRTLNGIRFVIDPFGQIHYMEGDGTQSMNKNFRTLRHNDDDPKNGEFISPETDIIVDDIEGLPFIVHTIIVGPVEADVKNILPKAWDFAAARAGGLLDRALSARNMTLPEGFQQMTGVEFINSLAGQLNPNNVVSILDAACLPGGDGTPFMVAVPPPNPALDPDAVNNLLNGPSLMSVYLTQSNFTDTSNAATAMMAYINPFQPGDDTDMKPENLIMGPYSGGTTLDNVDGNQFGIAINVPGIINLLPDSNPIYQTEESAVFVGSAHEFTHVILALLGKYPDILNALKDQQISELGKAYEQLRDRAYAAIDKQSLNIMGPGDRTAWVDSQRKRFDDNFTNELIAGMTTTEWVGSVGH